MTREVLIVLGIAVLTGLGGWYAIHEGTIDQVRADQLIAMPHHDMLIIGDAIKIPSNLKAGDVFRVIDDNNTD